MADISTYVQPTVSGGNAIFQTRSSIVQAKELSPRKQYTQRMTGIVLALESDGKVVIAGDTQASKNGIVSSKRIQRVFDFGSIGAGVVGEINAIQQFRNQLEDALKSREFETDEKIVTDRTRGTIQSRNR